jgi:hypothetical protein
MHLREYLEDMYLVNIYIYDLSWVEVFSSAYLCPSGPFSKVKPVLKINPRGLNLSEPRIDQR